MTPRAGQRRPVEWLVPHWIPLGKVVTLDGDPGLGKSTLLLDIAARVSSHGISFTGKQGATGNVVLISAEDNAEDTIRPRLEAAANLDRITEITHVTFAGKDRPIELPADIELIESIVAETDARLLIIEPLAAFLAGADANKDQDIRRVLYRLSKVAERRDCTTVTMRHLNKSSGGKALYRGNMSIGVIGHARIGLLVGEDPDDERYRVLAMAKINCAAKQASLRFALEPVPELDVCKIAWLGPAPYSADQLVSTQRSEEQKELAEEKLTKVEQAKAILEWLLESSTTGKLVVKDAKAELASAGLSGSSVDRAVNQLGLVVQYDVNEEDERIYYWVRKGADV
jgi:hypothetical protein